MSQDPADFIIRPAQECDMEAIVGLLRRVYEEVYAPRYADLARDVPTMYQELLEQPELCNCLLVAEADGRIVGSSGVVGDMVHALHVETEMRGKGIGAALLAAAEQKLRDRGVIVARLLAVRDYPDIMAFYEGQGWQHGRSSRSRLWDIPVREMTKQLRPWPRTILASEFWNRVIAAWRLLSKARP